MIKKYKDHSPTLDQLKEQKGLKLKKMQSTKKGGVRDLNIVDQLKEVVSLNWTDEDYGQSKHKADYKSN